VIVQAALKKEEMKSIEDVPFNMGTSIDSQVMSTIAFFFSFLFFSFVLVVLINVLIVRLSEFTAVYYCLLLYQSSFGIELKNICTSSIHCLLS
jgi:hypothetical protein